MALESIEAFSYYIRGMTQMIGFVLSIIEGVFDGDEAEIMLLLKTSVVFEIILVLLLIGFVFRSRREIYKLKREVFT